MFIVPPKEMEKLSGSKFSNTRDGCGEYYKRYEHDEIPVKDYGTVNKSKEIGTGDNKKISLTNSELDQLETKILKTMPDYSSVSRSNDVGTGDNRKNSLTNSELDQLETKILKNMSEELQTNGKSMTSLESNIQFFKVTVQQIFDNFYTTMQDFDHYKKKFHDILEKNRAESLPEMEEFIKDMIHHIMSSESVSNRSTASTTLDVKEQTTNLSINEIGKSTSDEGSDVLEAFKNDDFLTDSTDSTRIKRCTKKGDMFNIYLLTGTPCMEFKMNERNLLSEINIREPNSIEVSKIASADDLRNADVRKKQMEKYENQQHESNCTPDREIPVRISSAKKNIYLDEDFVQERAEKPENRSFMSKLCNFLCKKLRKNSIG